MNVVIGMWPVSNKKTPPSGDFLLLVGQHDPKTNPLTILPHGFAVTVKL